MSRERRDRADGAPPAGGSRTWSALVFAIHAAAVRGACSSGAGASGPIRSSTSAVSCTLRGRLRRAGSCIATRDALRTALAVRQRLLVPDLWRIAHDARRVQSRHLRARSRRHLSIRRALRRSRAAATASAAASAPVRLRAVVEIGNYNFVTPYAHEATHGLAIGIGLLVCALRKA